MDSQETDIVLSEPKTYQELIDQGKNYLLSNNSKGAQISFSKASELVDDKYEAYMLLSQSFENDNRPTINQYILALEYANNQIERLKSIVAGMEYLGYTNISLYVHWLIKQVDPNHDHEIPKNFDDYNTIVKGYIYSGNANFAKNPIEKLIEFSENKVMVLIQIGYMMVDDGFQYQCAKQYFDRALQMQEDKYDLLMRIGDIYRDNYYTQDLSHEFYNEAQKLKPDCFEPQLRIIKLKLKLELFQEALDYVKTIQIPEDTQSYIDVGLSLITINQLYNDGQEYILKGIELSQNKLETITQLISQDQLIGTKIKILLFEKALEIKSDDENMWEIYIQHLLKFEEKSEQIVNVIDRALAYYPNDDQFYLHKGNLLVDLERKDEAIEVLKKGIELCPIYRYQQTLGKLLLEAKQLDEGLKQYNLVIFQEQDALNNLMEELYSNEYYDECLEACDRHIQKYPNQTYTIYLKANRYDEALPILQQLVEAQNYYTEFAEEMISKINEVKQGKQILDQNVEEQ